ncbi:MAG TPA: hypothetical protein ENJ09_06230 [Planctomycetes bacterium]|nr:hypothetical protein [Planctomycetota bacterium]
MSGLGRVAALLGARLRTGPDGGSPIAAMLPLVLVSGVFCALIGGVLAPFPYAISALTLCVASVAIPLLGELGWILRRDAAHEWVAALPVRSFELRLARTAHLLVVLFALALASLVPAAVFLPDGSPGHAFLTLPLLGLGLVSLLASFLLAIQNLLGERAEGLLIGVQTVLVGAVALGVILGVRFLPTLAHLGEDGGGLGGLLLFPPTWFALPFADGAGTRATWWPSLTAGAVGLAVLLALPPAAAPRAVRTPWLAILLTPLRTLATRSWVRREERGIFDLIFDALPREREVVLRTVPMIGIPLAMLAFSSDEGGARSSDLMALLLFTVPIYLPILLTQVATSATPRASWLHRTAPIRPEAVAEGTVKALTLRFLVPLYAVLATVAWARADLATSLRLAPPAFLLSVLVLRRLHSACVFAPPLSVAPSETRFDQDWIGLLGGLALGLAGIALAVSRLVTLPGSIGLAVLLIAIEGITERRRWGPSHSPASEPPSRM